MNWSDIQVWLKNMMRENQGMMDSIARNLGIDTSEVEEFVLIENEIPHRYIDGILRTMNLQIWIEGLKRTDPLSDKNLTYTDPGFFNLAVVGGVPGSVRPMLPRDFSSQLLGSAPAHFPEVVLEYLDQGRACMAYGGFHLPLLTVGLGQIAQAAEAAIREYAKRSGLQVVGRNGKSIAFAKIIEKLRSEGRLTDDQATNWENYKEVRNMLSHPDENPSVSVGTAHIFLTNFTYALLELFPATQNST